MEDERTYEVDSTKFGLDIPSFEEGRGVWTPDTFELKIREDTGEEIHHSYFGFEHLFWLLDQVHRGESGDILWGSSGILVRFSENGVALRHKGFRLTGTPESVTKMVREFICEAFEQMYRAGIDTEEVAQRMKEKHFIETTDPVTIHDDCLEDYRLC